MRIDVKFELRFALGIGFRDYYYLNYREGDKVRSDYIPAADVAIAS